MRADFRVALAVALECLCWGAWMTYGLGAQNQNLPSYVVLHDTRPRRVPMAVALGRQCLRRSTCFPSVPSCTWERDFKDTSQKSRQTSLTPTRPASPQSSARDAGCDR